MSANPPERCSEQDKENGFVFKSYSSLSLNKAVDRAQKAYSKQEIFEELVEAGLKADFSWDKSAKKYVELYKKVVKLKK